MSITMTVAGSLLRMTSRPLPSGTNSLKISSPPAHKPNISNVKKGTIKNFSRLTLRSVQKTKLFNVLGILYFKQLHYPGLNERGRIHSSDLSGQITCLNVKSTCSYFRCSKVSNSSLIDSSDWSISLHLSLSFSCSSENVWN